jgi:hypothetical protein
MSPSRLQPLVRVALLLVAGLLAPPVRAATGAHGTIRAADGGVPLAGARVKLFHLGTSALFLAEPSGPKGEWSLTDLPDGEFDLAVETARGLWLADHLVTLRPGHDPELSITLRERAYWEGTERMPERATPLGTEFIGLALIETGAKTGAAGSGRGRKVGLAVGLGAGLLAAALSGGGGGDQPPASPSVP